MPWGAATRKSSFSAEQPDACRRHLPRYLQPDEGAPARLRLTHTSQSAPLGEPCAQSVGSATVWSCSPKKSSRPPAERWRRSHPTRSRSCCSARARGDATPDSDFDFLVVERDPADRHAEMVRLGRTLRPFGMPFDIIVVSERYAQDWEGVEGSMVHAALTEGRVLHAAA